MTPSVVSQNSCANKTSAYTKAMKGMNRIQDAPDDVVIQICQYLSVEDILAFRQTCKHAFAVSCIKTLWIHLCTTHVTARGIPFPDTDRIERMSAPELEIATREALDRDRRLYSESPQDEYSPKTRVDWQANQNSAISEIFFVPDPNGHEGRCIVTVSKGIWCLICLWDVQSLGRQCGIAQTEPKSVGRWSPKGAIFTSIAVNSDCQSEASAAVGVNRYGGHIVYILSFFDNAASGYAPRIQVLRTWDSSLSICSSVSLRGDILVAADSRGRATVVNIHSPEDGTVTLESTTTCDSPQTSNVCLQIQISQKYILVARAKFVEVFDFPTDVLGAKSAPASSRVESAAGNGQDPVIRQPVDSFSFGWLDGISISQHSAKPDTFFVLFPQPNEDPWSTHAPTMTFYLLEANCTTGGGEYFASLSATTHPISHLFSETFLASIPLSASSSPTSTSSSTSTKLLVGRHRTALWLSPRPSEWDSTGLVQMDLNRQEDWPSQTRGVRTWRNCLGEDLVWTSFYPGRTKAETRAEGDESWADVMEEEDLKPRVFMRRVLNSRDEDWTAIGYDEETGRVALGGRDGGITFLRL